MILVLLVMVGGLGWVGSTAWKGLNKTAEEKYGYRPNTVEWTLVTGAGVAFLFTGLTMIPQNPLAALAGVVLGVVLLGATLYSIARETDWGIALGSVLLQSLAVLGVAVALCVIFYVVAYYAVRFFGTDEHRV